MARECAPIRRALAFESWPQADRNAWNRAIKDAGPFDDPGQARHWSAETRRRYTYTYGRWLSFLTHTGRFDPAQSPADRVTLTNLEPFVVLLQSQVKSATVWSYLSALHNMLYRCAPDQNWDWLREIVNRLHRLVQAREDLPRRLRPIGDLFEAGLCMARTAYGEAPRRPLDNYVHVRDGLMIALLASAPMRLTNFACIRIGVHLIRTDVGYSLCIPRDEVKNNQPIEIEMIEELVPVLDRYLNEARPQMLGDHSIDYLWISKEGRPLKPHHVGNRISKVTNRLFGVEISPHLFRHCAATTLATTSPRFARMIKPLLAHTSSKTGEKYYNWATIIDAGRRHADTLQALREHLVLSEGTSPTKGN